MPNNNHRYLNHRIHPLLLIMIGVLLITIIGLLIFHTSSIKYWQAKYRNAANDLNNTQEKMNLYKSEYEKLQQDVQRYDSLYGQQNTELKYSKEIAFLELNHKSASYDCLTPLNINVSSLPTIKVYARGHYSSGWPVMHIFVNGKQAKSFDVNSGNFTTYSADTQMLYKTNYVDIIFSNVNSKRYVDVNGITVDGKTIPEKYTYLDMGEGAQLFDCYSQISGWTVNQSASIRFAIGS